MAIARRRGKAQGTRANDSGKDQESQVPSILKFFGFKVMAYVDFAAARATQSLKDTRIVATNVPYRGVYDNEGPKTEFLLYIADDVKPAMGLGGGSAIEPFICRIECKRQCVGGTVDEKFPFYAMTLETFPERNVILLADLNGARETAVTTLRGWVEGRVFRKEGGPENIVMQNQEQFVQWIQEAVGFPRSREIASPGELDSEGASRWDKVFSSWKKDFAQIAPSHVLGPLFHDVYARGAPSAAWDWWPQSTFADFTSCTKPKYWKDVERVVKPASGQRAIYPMLALLWMARSSEEAIAVSLIGATLLPLDRAIESNPDHAWKEALKELRAILNASGHSWHKWHHRSAGALPEVGESIPNEEVRDLAGLVEWIAIKNGLLFHDHQLVRVCHPATGQQGETPERFARFS